MLAECQVYGTTSSPVDEHGTGRGRPPSLPRMPSRALDPRLSALTRGVRRAVLRRRRLLAAACLAGAVLTGLQAVAPPPPPTVPVLTAARDLAAGRVLGPDDLRTARFASGTEPSGGTTAAEAVGRVLAAPLRRGEPVTDLRLVSPDLLSGYPGLVAAPVPLPDPAVAGLLRVGDRVDLLAADPRGGEATVLADDAPVIALPAAPDGMAAEARTRLVVLGLTESASRQVAAASVQAYLAITISR